MFPTRLLFFASTLLAGIGLALYLTPIIRRGAIRYGVLDTPFGAFKQHKTPVPYLGGIAVYLSFLLTLSFVFDFRAQLLGMLLGGTLMVMLGLFDDMRVLPAGLKLIAQLIAAWVVLRSDIAIELVLIPEWFRLPLTVAWIIGMSNAINILDVSDGLASVVSAVIALSLFALAVLSGDFLIATTSLALAGSLFGFLRYNWAPARIYLGDAGSLFVGFMLAVLSMVGEYTHHTPLGALAPLFVLIVPLLETALVVIARAARGQSPMHASTDHLALRLKHRGWSAQRVAWSAAAVSACGGAAAIGCVLGSEVVAMTLALTIVTLFVALLVALLVVCPAPSAAYMKDSRPEAAVSAQVG